MEAILLCDKIEVYIYIYIYLFIYVYTQQYSTIVTKAYYFVRGDMFRQLMRPSSSQLKVEQVP